jgi:hypothetical protein
MPQTPGLATDPRTTAFRWAVKILRADPTLKRFVDNWFTRDGKPNQGMDLVELPPRTIRLTPTWEPEEAETAMGGRQVCYRCPVRMDIETAYTTLDVDHVGDIAGVIAATLKAKHEEDRLGSRESCISWLESLAPAQFPGENPAVVGSVRLVCFITR